MMAASKRLGHKDVMGTMRIYAHLLKNSDSLFDRWQHSMNRIRGNGIGNVIPTN
jgi:integrase